MAVLGPLDTEQSTPYSVLQESVARATLRNVLPAYQPLAQAAIAFNAGPPRIRIEEYHISHKHSNYYLLLLLF